jgi:hypothetical protein
MKRFAETFALLALCCLAALPAQARKKAKPEAEKSEPAASKPVKVASFGDWGAYLAKGKSKTCYTLASPKERKPDAKRETAYVFIADRPAEKVHNEVSIIMGFAIKPSAAPTAKVGTTSFDLIAKGSNAWIKNQADEAKFVEALKHSAKLVVKAAPAKGPATTDIYALSGFRQALDRINKECK